MRLLVTADLHYNHGKSRPLAEDVIRRMNDAGGDALLVIGDTATSDGDALERCLSLFTFTGPKLFVAGNHELWTPGDDSYELFTTSLPARIRALGWRWLETEPLVAGDVAIVGSVGWYDYSFAQPGLEIPRRFYAEKISPGAAEHFERYAPLLEGDDITPTARAIIARWNDGKFVKLHRSDEAFLDEILMRLDAQLRALANVSTIVSATHHLPFRELLPPSHRAQWDFAKAYLGSDKLGELLQTFPNIRHALCGHSHFPATATIGHIHALNIGSGYRWKTFHTIDLP